MYVGQFESIFDFKPKKLSQTKQACDVFVIDKKSLLDECKKVLFSIINLNSLFFSNEKRCLS